MNYSYLVFAIITLFIGCNDGLKKNETISSKIDSEVFQTVLSFIVERGLTEEEGVFIDFKRFELDSLTFIDDDKKEQLEESRKLIVDNYNFKEGSMDDYLRCPFPGQMLPEPQVEDRDFILNGCKKYTNKQLITVSVPEITDVTESIVKVVQYTNQGYKIMKFIIERKKSKWEVDKYETIGWVYS